MTLWTCWGKRDPSCCGLCRWCRPECGWNSVWRGLREHQGIVSSGEVNWLSDWACGDRLPAIDLAHVDLPGGKQRPEQHGRGIGRRQHGLGLDSSLELLVQPLDCVGRSRALPLARRQAREGEQALACFLQTVGDRTVLEPPLADKGLSARLDLLARGRVKHVAVVGL